MQQNKPLIQEGLCTEWIKVTVEIFIHCHSFHTHNVQTMLKSWARQLACMILYVLSYHTLLMGCSSCPHFQKETDKEFKLRMVCLSACGLLTPYTLPFPCSMPMSLRHSYSFYKTQVVITSSRKALYAITVSPSLLCRSSAGFKAKLRGFASQGYGLLVV